jgi:hypothetical protein
LPVYKSGLESTTTHWIFPHYDSTNLEMEYTRACRVPDSVLMNADLLPNGNLGTVRSYFPMT